MNADIKRLNGFLNSDDPNEELPQPHHKMARNVRFRGNGNNMQAEGIPGTTAIVNEDLPAGTNECIGAFYDDIKQRIFYFNYNSNGDHGIYQYTISDGAVVPIAISNTNTDGDIFNFTLDGSICSVKMLYGDEVSGDTLYFNNSQKEPCEINIDRALSGGYGTIKRSFIDVIKAPAIMPPAAVYENDNTVTVNNLRKKLYKAKVRFVYSNKNKSVTSAQSELPLPVNYADTAIDKDPTKNCRIAFVVPTGEEDVDKIEILVAESDNNVFSDFFLVKVVDKSAESVASNDLYTFRFYNNQAYLPIDVTDSIQLQDLVPLEANAIEFLNGNVPVYGGIKEGFDQTKILGSTTSSYVPQQTTYAPYIFVGNQSGDSGFGTGNIHIVVVGVPTIGDVFNVYTTGSTISFTATAATSTNVITGLAAAAVVAGFTVVSSDTENLVIVKTAESLQRVLATTVASAVTDSAVYDRNARYNFAVTYYDAAGRTIGAETNTTLPVQTINYTETATVPNIPLLQVSISNRPPLNARYFHICRSQNLSKLTKLEWVSDRTFKDAQYAYISIENLNQFILENPSAAHLAYDFSAGDRIRFMKVLSGTVNTVYTNQDFEIQSQVLSPTIDGEVREGQFIKIALPATTGTFDFGTTAFNNYFIELYTPAKSVAEGIDKYYEFAERYTIGNPGTANAYHQGMTQNQTSDLVTPALFEFKKGDYYYRNRVINSGGDLEYIIFAGERGAGRHTMGVTFESRTFTDANIVTGDSPLQNLSGWTYASNSRAIIKMGVSAPTTTFRARGTIKVDFLDPDTFSYFFQNNLGAITYAVTPRAVPNTPSFFTFDCTFTLSAGQHISFLGWSEGDFTDSKQYSQTDLKITIQNPFTVGVIDPNFSDFFPSAVNSNGRPLIVDENAAQVYNPTLLRWGLAYEPNTNINQTNRFRELNFDEVDGSKGDIRVLFVREMILQIIQSRGVCQKGIYGKFIQDNGGANILTTTDDILTKNNADYYKGRWGIGDQPTAHTSSDNAFYYIDSVTGEHIRLSASGQDSISVQNKGQYYIKNLLTPYSNNYIRTNGSRARVILFYDGFEDNCMTILQAGTLGDATISAQTFSFNEKRNSYESFYDIFPEMAVGSKKKNYYWLNGAMYSQDNETTWCKFFGTQYYPSITVVFNDKIMVKKTMQALAYESNQYWESPTNGDIRTSQPNPQTGLPQISQLISRDYEISEGLYYAALLRDANSGSDAANALVNGDYLKGVWTEVKLTYRGSNYAYLYGVYLSYDISQRNF